MFTRSEVVEQAGDLERPGDALVGDLLGLQTSDVFAEDGDRAHARLDEPGEEVEERGLAGAVRTDQRVHITFDDPEVDVAYGTEATEVLGDALSPQGNSWCRCHVCTPS